MAIQNVRVSVTDPDLLIAGNSPYAEFVVASIQLYRWSTEALARAGNPAAGDLVTTWTLIASTEEQTEDAGPWSFTTYDSAAADTDWYAYRYVNAGVSLTSLFSDPWKVSRSASATLRDILWEIVCILGETGERGTATAGSTTSVTCAAKLGSSLRANNYFKGHWLTVLTDAGGLGAVPEGEEALIASDVASTGVATLDRTLTAAIASGDVFMTSALIRPSEMIRCVNRALEGMKVLQRIDVAVHPSTDVYGAPIGTRGVTDIYEVLGVQNYGVDTNTEGETPVHYETWSNRGQVYVKVVDPQFPLVRVVSEVSYRDMEGQMALMGDTTSAPIEWLKYAAAAECMKILVRDDGENNDFMNMKLSIDSDLAIATGRYATRMPARQAKKLRQRLVGPARY